jgi:hypothetical protein
VPTGVVLDTAGIRLQTSSGTPSFDSEGQVQGRLEVKIDGSWATVGDFSQYEVNFGEAGSTVACRQLGNELGYTLVSASLVDADLTVDGQNIPVYKATCAGTESTLDSCTLEWWGPSYHEYDVGVSCTFLVLGLNSDECGECVAGKFSDTTGKASCMKCAAGSHSTGGAAASCEQVRIEQRQSEREDKRS